MSLVVFHLSPEQLDFLAKYETPLTEKERAEILAGRPATPEEFNLFMAVYQQAYMASLRATS